MQFIDLNAQYIKLKKEIDNNIQKVLEHGKYIMGPEVYELEEKLADYVGVRHCISCANGTDALSMVLMAWDIGPGDAVFVPAFTFMATAEVVSLVGATPIFVDIDINTFNMDSTDLTEKIHQVLNDGKLIPKVIIPVDLFGQPADYEVIEKIAEKHDLLVLEDGAQGFGGSIGNKKACSFGNAATTSFFPAKPLGCYGDGGAVFTNDDVLASLVKSIRIHGKGNEKYDNVRIGVNSRLDTIQASVLLPKFEAFKEYELELRNKWASQYSQQLNRKYIVPHVSNGVVSSWAQYTIRCNDSACRKSLHDKLKKNGIPSMVYYPRPLHLQTAFSYLHYEKNNLTNAEVACETVLSLPMHPYLTSEAIMVVCDLLNE